MMTVIVVSAESNILFKIKQIKLTIIKKNRVWFECKNANGYKCKLKINKFTKDLIIGDHDLELEDISVKSKYGTDLRYQMFDKKSYEKIFLTHHTYNSILHKKCKDLGGRWDEEAKAWVFLKIVEEEVELIEEVFSSELVTVEIELIKIFEHHINVADFFGYTIVKRKSMYSSAEVQKDVYKVFGEIGTKQLGNWYKLIEKGSKFRLKVPKKLLENEAEREEEYWAYKIIETNK